MTLSRSSLAIALGFLLLAPAAALAQAAPPIVDKTDMRYKSGSTPLPIPHEYSSVTTND